MATEEVASVVVAKTTVVVVEATTTTTSMMELEQPEAPAMAPEAHTDMAEAPQQEEEPKIEPNSVNKGRRNTTSKVFKKRVAKKEPEPEASDERKEREQHEDKAMEVSEGAKANGEAAAKVSEDKKPVKRARSKMSDEKKQPKGEAATNGSKKPVGQAKSVAAHPPYLQMIMEAIFSLKDRTGSSLYAIAKYIEEKYHSGLPDNFKKTLSVQLRNLANNGKLIRVKNSFKLSEDLKKAAASAAKVNSSKPTSTKTISEVYQADSVEKSKKSTPKKATPAAKRARRAVK